ncbi:AMP-binding protein, partial [Pelagibacteraceae bacterium]|nr:AMP-binding protein [Pelagibacteraceae bacterium]
ARNLQSNASSIVNYLQISTFDKAITSLPLHYSFGLSVLNSFLEANAEVVLTSDSILTKGFWKTFKEQNVSFFAGVPFSFEILSQLRFKNMQLPSLNCLVQAGGRLTPDKIKIFEKIAKEKKSKLFIMYGQTEATARISYVPPEKLKDKSSSIGIAIPDGKLYLKLKTEDSEEGELIYEGPNVMLGYANSIKDLALGDQMGGRLPTGDLATKDEDGYFYLTGRMKRFLKLYGLRFNLDEAESLLNKELNCPTICFGNDECLQIRIASHHANYVEKATEIISKSYGIHHTKLHVKLIEEVPRTSSGKIKYSDLL